MPGPPPIADALLPAKAALLAFYSAVGGACGLARAANAAGAVPPSLWLFLSMMTTGLALGAIAGGLCMWRLGTDDGAFYLSFAISGLCGLLGPAVALKILKFVGAKGVT